MTARQLWFAGLFVWAGFALVTLILLLGWIPWRKLVARRPALDGGRQSPEYENASAARVTSAPATITASACVVSPNELGARPGKLAVARDWRCPTHGENAFSCCMQARRK